MARAFPILILIAVVFGVLATIVALTSGTLQHVLVVVALPVLTALGTPLALAKIRRVEPRVTRERVSHA